MNLDELRLDPDVQQTDVRRGHSLIPDNIGDIPKLYSTENVGLKEKTLLVHYFVGSFDWYMTEFDPEDCVGFGYVTSDMAKEWGYFNLHELATVLARGTFVVERDLYWTPKTVGEL